MKTKVSKREIRQRFGKVLMLNCGENLFAGLYDAFAYSTRAEGWACDYWFVNGVCFCSGYSPIGERVDPKLEQEYSDKLRANYYRYHLSYNRRKAIAKRLISNFVVKASK